MLNLQYFLRMTDKITCILNSLQKLNISKKQDKELFSITLERKKKLLNNLLFSVLMKLYIHLHTRYTMKIFKVSMRCHKLDLSPRCNIRTKKDHPIQMQSYLKFGFSYHSDEG